MAPLLTDRQFQELNKSIVQYLKPLLQETTEDKETLNMLTQKLLQVDSVDKYISDLEPTIPTNYLEKKWSTLLRLQKKIYDLEKENSENKELIANYSNLLQSASSDSSLGEFHQSKLDWIPNRVKSSLKYHQSSVTSIAIHPYKPIIASGSNDGMIVIWNLLDLSEPEIVIKNAHTRSVNSLDFQVSDTTIDQTTSKKVLLLASCSSDLLIKLWDATTGKVFRTLAGHDHSVSTVTFSASNPTQLISCSRDKSIKVWDVVSGWCTRTIIGHSDWVRSVSVNHANGDYILSCSNDQSVRLSDLNTGVGIGLCLGHEQVVEDVIFLPVACNEYLDTCLEILNLVVSEDDKLMYIQVGYKYAVSCGRDSLIKIWLLPLPDLRIPGKPMPSSNPKGVLIYEIKGHSSWIRNLKVHPNGQFLASCSDDKTIKIWDLKSLARANKGGDLDLRSIRELKGHESFVNCFRFAEPVLSDEYYFVDTGDKGLDALKKKQLLESGMRCYLVSGSADNTVKVWV